MKILFVNKIIFYFVMKYVYCYFTRLFILINVKTDTIYYSSIILNFR